MGDTNKAILIGYCDGAVCAVHAAVIATRLPGAAGNAARDIWYYG